MIAHGTSTDNFILPIGNQSFEIINNLSRMIRLLSVRVQIQSQLLIKANADKYDRIFTATISYNLPPQSRRG